MDIELFAMNTRVNQAGLLGPIAPPNITMTDEEEYEIERMANDVEMMGNSMKIMI